MQLPLFKPQTTWVAPTEFPNLAGAKEVALDLETKDPNLKTIGSGWPRKDGHIAGVALAVEGSQWYFPMRHELGPNLDARQVLRFVQSVVKDPSIDVICHNAPYDIGWLSAEGVSVAGRVFDTMVAAPLLDENRLSYALNSLGRDYLNDRKDERLLREAATDFGVDAKAEMFKLPAEYVGAYAEQDASLTLRLWTHFKGLIQSEDIGSIFDLECRVQAATIRMRRRGVRVDVEGAYETKKRLVNLEKELLHSIKKEYGVDVEVWSAASVAQAFDAANLSYSQTANGQPSFTKDFLKNHEHDLPKRIVRVREVNKMHSTFLDSILRYQHNGRIHAEIHSLRSDDGGTITGRFSYSDPNLQQIPSPEKDKELAPLVRGLFLPEEHEQWGAFDYSSQEPRLLVHYASLMGYRGADVLRDAYRADRTTDLHQWCADIMGITRKAAKTINLGLMYGMGKAKLASQLGLSKEEADGLFNEYHTKVPFVLELSTYASNRALNKGVIRTLLGRRCRFDMWEPMKYGLYKPLPYKEAYAEHGPSIRRAWTYKALNKLIQGSAADQTKQALVAADEAGILAHLQVHDELGFSIATPEQAKLVVEVMENCVQLEVPSLVDAEFGKSWGQAKLKFEEAFA